MRWCSYKGFIPKSITSLRRKKKKDGSIGFGTSIPCTMCTKKLISFGVKKAIFAIENDDETVEFYESELIHILPYTSYSVGVRFQRCIMI